MAVMIKWSQIDNRWRHEKSASIRIFGRFPSNDFACHAEVNRKAVNGNVWKHSQCSLEHRHRMSGAMRKLSARILFRFIFSTMLRQPETHWTSIFFSYEYIWTTKTDRLICRIYFLYCVMLELPTNTINHDKSAIFCSSFSSHSPFSASFLITLEFIKQKALFKNCLDALNTINLSMFTFPFYSSG